MSVPPYDLILFFTQWGLAMLVWAIHELCLCRKWRARSGVRPSEQRDMENATPTRSIIVVPTPRESQVGMAYPGEAKGKAFVDCEGACDNTETHPPHPVVQRLGSESGDSAQTGSHGADEDLHETALQDAPPTGSASTPQARAGRRFLLYFFGGGAASWVSTCIIFAVLGLTSVLGSLLFTPQPAHECVASCAYSSKEGLDGWVDETCCTYTEDVGQYDVWLSFTPESGVEHVTHGYLMVNDTPAHPGQGRVTMLYNHGSGGNVASGYRLERYRFLLAQGNIAIFVYDYPGYGKSTQTAQAGTVMDAAVNAAAWFVDWDAAGWPSNDPSILGNATHPRPPRRPVGTVVADGLDLRNITLLGRSLGGTTSTYVGSVGRWSARSLLIQSVFPNVAALAKAYFVMFGWVWAAEATSRYPAYDTLRNLKANRAPDDRDCVYHYHSWHDDWVPYKLGVSVEDAVETVRDPTCSTWVTTDDAIHTQPLTLEERRALPVWLNTSSRV